MNVFPNTLQFFYPLTLANFYKEEIFMREGL